MKLWGWWRKENKPENNKLLEDVQDPPKQAPPQVVTPPKAPTLSQALGSIGVEDFKQLPQMPCFRNAMLSGLGVALTAATVVFAFRREVSKSVNYAVGGFTVGSVVTWEQCRYRRLRSKRNVRKAQELYRTQQRDEEK